LGRINVVLLIIPLLASGLFIVPIAVPAGHSDLVGLVCVAKAGNTSCPSSPPLLNASGTIPSQVKFAIVINGSAGLVGLDITVYANHTILRPTGIDFTGSVLIGAPTIFLECIGGVKVAGSGTCAPTTDTVDTIHLTATSSPGSPLTSPPTTGLLFTAIYTTAGTSYNSPIGFQTGCSNTSVPGLCVTIGNGTPNSDAERAQGARFTDLAYFTLEASSGFGAPVIFINTRNQQLFLNLTRINGFTGTVTVTSSTPPPGITIAPVQFSVKVNATNPGTQVQPSVNVTAALSTNPGIYNLNFTGTSPGVPPNPLTITLTVPKPDFSISSTPVAVNFNVTARGSSIITVASIGNFTGIVNLALGIPAGLNASLARTQLTIPAQGFSTTTLSLNSTIYGVYTLNITATSGQLAHTISVPVTALDFTMQVGSQLVLTQGATAQEVVKFSISSAAIYTVKVNITKIYIQQNTANGPISPSTGISVSCTPTSLTVTNSSSGSQQIVPSNCNVKGNQAGNYTVTILAIAGGGKLSHSLAFNVEVLGPDFTIVPSTTVQTVNIGKSTTISLQLTRLLGLNQSVTPIAKFTPDQTFLTASVNPAKLFLNSTANTATATITIVAGPSTPTGTYFLLVTAFPHALTLTIVVTTTSSPNDLAIYSVTPSTLSTTAGTDVAITIIAQNLGSVQATSTVVAIAGDQSVGQQNVTIAPGANATVTITWHTSGFGTGAFMVGGKILAVSGETNLSNNLLRSATPVTLTSANTSVLDSPYFQPSLIGALIVIVGIIAALFLQARRKAPRAAPAA